MKKITETLSKEIVAAQEGEIVGIVTNAYVSQKLARVRGYKVSSEDRDAGRLLPIRRVIGEGDALIVKGVDVLQEPTCADCPLGAKVFDTVGVFHGILRDLLFEEKTGVILSLIADDTEIDPLRVVSFGKSAVILRAPCHEKTLFRVRKSAAPTEPTVKKPEQPTLIDLAEAATPLSLPADEPQSEPTQELFAGEYAFLLGRTVLKNIFAGEEPVAERGETVTPELITKAREKGKLVELTVNSRKQ